MAFNSAYREDTQNTMSNVTLEYTRNVATQIRETFLSGPPPPPPTPQPVIHFDLQTWEANQTVITKDGSVYETNMTSYPDYADGLTWALVPKANSVPMVENVTFPPAGSSFKLELIWKDKGVDGSQSFGFTFHSSGVLGFLFQKSGIKVQMFLRKTDGSTILFKPLQNVILNDIPIDLTYKQIFTYNADTRGYTFEHFEGDDLTNVNASDTGFIPIEDGDWGYGPTNEYQLNNNGNQEYLKITVTTPPPGPVIPPWTVVERDETLSVLSADFTSVNDALGGVLQMSATFQINIFAIISGAHFIHISGTPINPNARMGNILVLAQTATTATIQMAMHFHYRGYRSASFIINKNELITLGYTLEADGALRVFYNGTLVGDGGAFYQETLPLVPFVSIFDRMNIVTNISCFLGDVAYYKVQKSDAFMQNTDNYYINQQDAELIFGWKQNTFIDVVNGIPISIVEPVPPPPVFVK